MEHRQPLSGDRSSIILGDRGRLVLPAAIRERLDLHAGDRLFITVEPDGSLRLRSQREQVRRCRGVFADLAVPGRLASDDLIAERREEALRENAP